MKDPFKKCVLLYDSSNDFLRSIPPYVSKDYCFVNIMEIRNPSKVNPEDYDHILFIINGIFEVFDLLLFFPNTKPISVGTFDSELLTQVNQISGSDLIELLPGSEQIPHYIRSRVWAQ